MFNNNNKKKQSSTPIDRHIDARKKMSTESRKPVCSTHSHSNARTNATHGIRNRLFSYFGWFVVAAFYLFFCFLHFISRISHGSRPMCKIVCALCIWKFWMNWNQEFFFVPVWIFNSNKFGCVAGVCRAVLCAISASVCHKTKWRVFIITSFTIWHEKAKCRRYFCGQNCIFTICARVSRTHAFRIWWTGQHSRFSAEHWLDHSTEYL